ncbi:hypothetical protein NG54_03380 [Heyndrickxia ginsengihumi]|uniref:Phage gp6-like head-tail connector protein n=1 Tax=Heyndrickxia ginsengihumi TaxID=363870 RepID=A0A0A6VDP2_9BACI|nr:phage head-tail connector protein [Heyndrickxia ginsengihumi]KHD86370.1 hypothetical protein NG54_03380 [Heyndrickxia ginsengihumi]
MDLEELKRRLGITDNSQDGVLAERLEDAIDYAKTWCNNPFADGIPSGAKRGITLIVKSMGENSNVASQTLGDMSKTFYQDGTINEAHRYLRPYKKVRFI